MSSNTLSRSGPLGQSIWLESLRRDRIVSAPGDQRAVHNLATCRRQYLHFPSQELPLPC